MEAGCIKLSRLRIFQSSESKCEGNVMKLSTGEARKCGYRVEITVCLSHFNELKRLPQATCIYPCKSSENNCKGTLTPCPQRLFSVFYFLNNECIGTRICCKHLTEADKNESITEHENYLPPKKRKVRLLFQSMNLLKAGDKEKSLCLIFLLNCVICPWLQLAEFKGFTL